MAKNRAIYEKGALQAAKGEFPFAEIDLSDASRLKLRKKRLPNLVSRFHKSSLPAYPFASSKTRARRAAKRTIRSKRR